MYLYLTLYAIVGLIFDIWVACQIGGWTNSRMGKFGWILGFFLWPLFIFGALVDWLLSFHDDKNIGGNQND